MGCVMVAMLGTGCQGSWMANGFLDPTQTGNFTSPVRLEIRESLSILEEPSGIQEAEEPTPADYVILEEEEKLIAGDYISVSIFELLAPDVSTDMQMQIRGSGYVTVPVIGPIKVSGLTPRELELKIKEVLREGKVMENAEVRISVLRSEASQFTILGPVPRPGNYPIPSPNFRLTQAIAAAGGLPPQTEKLYVIREGAKAPLPTTAPVETIPVIPTVEQFHPKPSSLTMSDTAGGGVPTTAAASPSTNPATSQAQSLQPTSELVDEMDILEGKEKTPTTVPEFDAATGEWKINDTAASQNSEDESTSNTALPPEAAMPEQEGTSSAEAAETTSAEAEPPLPMNGEQEDKVRVLEIPIKGLLQGDPRYNIAIRPFDLVSVPDGDIGEYYLFGNVARPGAYALTGRRLTMKQAIAAAGGFGPLAWPSRADLVRRVSKDEEQIIQVDIDAIFAGKSPDFYLRPQDVVNVGSSPVSGFLAVMRNAFRLSYGFGFVYDRNFADADSFGAREQVKARRSNEAFQRGLPF